MDSVGVSAVAWLLAAVVVQVLSAGLSIFGDPRRWLDHVELGHWIGVLPVALVLLALAARLPLRLVALALLALILYGLQYTFVRAGSGFVAALHPVNAPAIFWTATSLARDTQRALPKRARAEPTPA